MRFDVSIIIPTYNVEQYIYDALNSIANQTFNGEIEVIVVDDCSTDQTIKIVQKFNHNGKFHLKLFKQEKNMRQGTARNRGITEASGKYIFFLDGDDLLHEEAIEKMYKKAEENAYDFVVCDWIYFNPDGQFKYVNIDKFMFNDELSGKHCEKLLEAITYFTVNKLYNREFLVNNHIKYGEGYIYEDYEFYVEVAQKANKIGIIHNPLYQVRVNTNSTTKTNRKSMIHVESLIKAVESTINKFNPRWEESYYQLYRYIIRKTLSYIHERAPKGVKRETLKKIIQILNNKNKNYYIPNTATIINSLYFRKKLVQNGKLNNILLIDSLNRKTKFKKALTKVLNLRKTSSWKNLYTKIVQKRASRLPIQNNFILFLGFDHRYEGNSKYLFDYLIRNNPQQYTILFTTKDENIPKEQRVSPYTKEFYYALSQAKIVIAESWVPLKFTKKDGQKWIQLWHGTPFKKMLFDSHERIISSNNIYHKKNKHADITRWDYLLSDSKIGSEKLSSSFAFPKHNILNFGYPRVQWLKENSNNEELIKQIKKQLSVPINKKIVLYVPTWRDYNYKTNDFDLSYELNVQKLQKSLGDDYVILNKNHHFNSKNNDHIHLHDVQNLILISDIMISDYSSVIFDGLTINKPFYLFINDFEKYSNSRGVYEDILNLLKPFCIDNEVDLAKKIQSLGSTYPLDSYQKAKENLTNNKMISSNEALQNKLDEIMNSTIG